MKVEVISEYGLNEAILGLGLSFGKTSDMGIMDLQYNKYTFSKLLDRAHTLSGKGLGHDKFLRMLTVWLDIKAPLYWWSQWDTYKIGTVAQSESKMHTLMKGEITPELFEGNISSSVVDMLEKLRKEEKFSELLQVLPCSFLQRRIVLCNYAVLQNVLRQRKSHKLPEWHMFCDAVIDGVNYSRLLTGSKEEDNG